MAEKKQYSFEDWYNGKLDKDYNEGLLEIESSTVRKLPLVKLANESGYINDEEFSRIQDAQRFTFYKALEITTNKFINDFKASYYPEEDGEELLNLEISEFEKLADKFSNHTKKATYGKKWNSSGIDYQKFLEVYELNKSGELKKIHFSTPSPIPDANYENPLHQDLLELMESTFKKIESSDRKSVPKPERKTVFVDNKLYDHSVFWIYLKFLKSLKDQDKKDQVKKELNYPDPRKIAELFIEESPNTKSKYSVSEYTFVMTYARDNHLQGNVSQLIRDIKDDEYCPELVKKNKDEKAIRRWIQFYDEKADIKRR